MLQVALSGEISELRLKIAIKQEIKDEPMDGDKKVSSAENRGIVQP